MDVDDEVFRKMEEEIEAMDISDDDETMDAFRDEYFHQQRDDVGTLEDLI